MNPPAPLGYANFTSNGVQTNRKAPEKFVDRYCAKQYFAEHPCLYQHKQPERGNILPNLKVPPSTTVRLHPPRWRFWPSSSPFVVISPVLASSLEGGCRHALSTPPVPELPRTMPPHHAGMTCWWAVPRRESRVFQRAPVSHPQ